MAMTKRELKRAAKAARKQLAATEKKTGEVYLGERVAEWTNINMNQGVYTPEMEPHYGTGSFQVPDKETRAVAEQELRDIYKAMGHPPERIDVLIERDKVWVHYGVIPYLIHRVHEVISRGFGGVEEKGGLEEEVEDCPGGAGHIFYDHRDGKIHKGPK